MTIILLWFAYENIHKINTRKGLQDVYMDGDKNT